MAGRLRRRARAERPEVWPRASQLLRSDSLRPRAITHLPNADASRVEIRFVLQGGTLDLVDEDVSESHQRRSAQSPPNGALDIALRALGFLALLLAAWKLFASHGI